MSETIPTTLFLRDFRKGAIRCTKSYVSLKINTIGTCLMQDNNRSFEIEIQKGLSFDEIVKTLCHEMVHVKQYARNEMTDSYWKGQMRWRNRFIDKNTRYSKLPWEREAYRKQNTLAKSYYNSVVDKI